MLSVGGLAEALGVHVSSVRAWVFQGHLRPDARTAGGHARFGPLTVRRLRRELSRRRAA